MLSHEENELLCRVGPETPMGRMLRRYWIPAVQSTDIVADGPPRRIRLLGENLVAFRDTNGRAGVLDENCPHRGASLVLARNEECGLRCLYHGWKIDVTGRVLETPPEPDELGFKDRVRAIAYPTYESGGFVWTYMGPPGTEPQQVHFEFAKLPESHRLVTTVLSECNWVQALEGVIDSAHSNYLHSTAIKPVSGPGATIFSRKENFDLDRPSNDGKPIIEVQDTSYGFRYAGIRIPTRNADTHRYARVTIFVAPFHGFVAAPYGIGFMQMFVPMDDEHTMFHYVRYQFDEAIDDVARVRHLAWGGTRPGVDTDHEYRKTRTRENNWLQDREAMRRGESWSGIRGVNNEDFAVQESMGPLYDRRKEHLGTSDVALIRMRRLMLDSVRNFTATGAPPLGLAQPVAYDKIRAEEQTLPIGVPWQSIGAFAGEPTEAGPVR
jgi:phthalate 4,5-dioxygenase oxygenase subunit